MEDVVEDRLILVLRVVYFLHIRSHPHSSSCALVNFSMIGIHADCGLVRKVRIDPMSVFGTIVCGVIFDLIEPIGDLLPMTTPVYSSPNH